MSKQAKTIDISKFTGWEKYQFKDSCDYDQIFTINNFYNKGLQCCKNVRWKRSTTEFELDMLCVVQDLLTKVNNNTYRAQPFNNFSISERGKKRNISAQKINDRLVQKVANQDIMLPIYQENFVEGNSASMRGKGKAWSIKLLTEQLKYHYSKYGVNGGILLGDYTNYFGSLPHEELKRRIRERITDTRTVKILCDAITDFRKIGPCHKVENWGYVGVGLGSEVSQTFALDYGSYVDHYIEDNFAISGYGRYMDDFYIICNSLVELERIKKVLFMIVQESGTQLNEKKTHIVPFKGHSFNFLKMNFFFDNSGNIINTPSTANKKIIRTRLKKFRRMLDENIFSIEDVCNSYNGWRANITGCKNSYRTLYSTDIYFVNLFREELSNREHPFKCCLKTFRNKDNKWVYVTKPLDSISKKHSKIQKKAIKRISTKEQKPSIKKKRIYGRFTKFV